MSSSSRSISDEYSDSDRDDQGGENDDWTLRDYISSDELQELQARTGLSAVQADAMMPSCLRAAIEKGMDAAAQAKDAALARFARLGADPVTELCRKDVTALRSESRAQWTVMAADRERKRSRQTGTPCSQLHSQLQHSAGDAVGSAVGSTAHSAPLHAGPPNAAEPAAKRHHVTIGKGIEVKGAEKLE